MVINKYSSLLAGLLTVVFFQNCSQNSFHTIIPSREKLSAENLNGELNLPSEDPDVDNLPNSPEVQPGPEQNSATGETYYVSESGSDSNPGTSTLPWRNPQKCAMSPVKSGDVCIVRKGIYTDHDRDGQVVYISTARNSPAGTFSSPITIKSEIPGAAVFLVPSIMNGANTGFYVARPYYRIEGFDISGGSKHFSDVSYSGITFHHGATGSSARFNKFHHIGRSACSDSKFGFSGIYVHDTADLVVENNAFYSIGRKRNGELGCVTVRNQNDHGIYIHGSTGLILRRNVFYDTNRGWPIHVFGGKVANLNVYHNTVSGSSPTGIPRGHIMLASTINGANISNNISSDGIEGMVHFYNLIASNISIHHNLSNNKDWVSSPPPGVTFFNNYVNISSIGFVNKTANDFRLVSSSSARNLGTTIDMPTVPDKKPDIGAYEF